MPSGTCRTPGLTIPWCCLPASSSVCLVFYPFSLCLARWFWPDLMNGKHENTTAVCFSLRSSCLPVVQLPAGSWHGLPRCTRCVVFCGSTSFPWLVFFFLALLWGSMIHKHTGWWMWQGSASVVSWSWEKYSWLRYAAAQTFMIFLPLEGWLRLWRMLCLSKKWSKFLRSHYYLAGPCPKPTLWVAIFTTVSKNTHFGEESLSWFTFVFYSVPLIQSENYWH